MKPFEFIKTDKGEVIAKGSYIAHESHVYITTKKQEVWDFFRKIQAKKQQIEYIEFTEYSIYSGPFIISSLSKDNETHKITVFFKQINVIVIYTHTRGCFLCSKKGGIKLTGIEKWILATVGVIGGLWSLVVDGLGLAVATLAVFMAIDYITGLIQAIYNKNLNSEIGFRGLVKKVYFLLLVGACYLFENLVFGTRHLADGVAISFVAMEFISIAENGVRMNAPFSGVFEAFLAIVKKTADGEDEVQ